MKKLILTLSVLSCFNAIAESNQNSIWQDFGQNTKSLNTNFLFNKPIKQRRLLLDESLLKSRLISPVIATGLATGIAAKSIGINSVIFEIDLPLPDGTSARVKATPSSVMSAEMAESYPELKTWNVVGLDDPDITGVIDFTSNGFHGMLMMPDGDTVFIDPDKDQAGDVYKSFSKKDNADAFAVEKNCSVHDDHDHSVHASKALEDDDSTEFQIKRAAKSLSSSTFVDVSISDIKTYRLALSATAEYTNGQGPLGTGGTKADARSSMVTSINRINPVFIRDLGVELELVDDPSLIFTDSANDPFSNPNDAGSLMIENGEYLSSQGKLAEFDIGHVLSKTTSGNGGSGVAFLGVACLDKATIDAQGTVVNGVKAAGATTSGNPNGETFDLVLLAHELGHQLGANHSFNSTSSDNPDPRFNNCLNGRVASLAVEPGSGSSIMAYGGLCASSDNLIETPRDDYFHFASISEINRYTRTGTGSKCGGTPTGGTIAAVNAGADLKIPANTPFLLDGTAAGGTSSWDQIDIGEASDVDVDNGGNAIIRHLVPSSTQDRYIPSLANLFAGTINRGENLPTTSRDLNFAYVVRNNGVVSDKKLVNVTDTGSAFSVTSQASNQTFTTNQSVDVSWNVAGTNQAPISCGNVDIQLIRENGVKNMLLASTVNDGSQSFTVPSATPVLSGARVLVTCSDNSFFNISSGEITVEKGAVPADTTKPVITLQGVNPISIVEGTNYTDAGATADDNVDGTIAVSSTNNVSTDVVGTYTVDFSATDTAGNNATVTRTVIVTPAPVVDIVEPVIEINGGDSNITIVEGTNYSYAGATATDNVDGDLDVTRTGNVDINETGTYTISYTATDSAGNSASASRTVTVTPAPVVVDTIDPVIEINDGGSNITIVEGTNYSYAGATATDNVDGDLDVTRTGSVDINETGTYTISYTATDSAGNSAIVSRTVTVTEDETLSNNLGDTAAPTASEKSGGGSFNYLLMPLMILLGLRRPKPVRVRSRTDK